ncbi:uncharacterized protein LOC128965342 [Oppia nitens]|uniref:uncharacterized protein LOC128965342 n=1 Tax=Oppia nitens TaxID=1686743 RepID=UPI0023DBCC05|nr:uncharacterized protein LOC128965342 [Oppia nitens]
MKKTSVIDNKMFYQNQSNGLNSWSQVVPSPMPWAHSQTNTTTTNTTPVGTVWPVNSTATFDPHIMQFTANTTTPLNSVSSLDNEYIGPNPLIINNSSVLDVLCPDPCTSQTATRWELLHNLTTDSQRRASHQHLKRRSDSSDDDIDDDGLRRPAKQYISEDKVSAIFNRLHITNSDFNKNDGINAVNENIDYEDLDDESNNETIDAKHNNTLVFANELQSAFKNKTITDKLVQNEIDKHSKALILWQPNTSILTTISLNSKSSIDNDNDVEDNDNSESSKTNDNMSDAIEISQEDYEDFYDDNDMILD